MPKLIISTKTATIPCKVNLIALHTMTRRLGPISLRNFANVLEKRRFLKYSLYSRTFTKPVILELGRSEVDVDPTKNHFYSPHNLPLEKYVHDYCYFTLTYQETRNLNLHGMTHIKERSL